MKGIQLRGTTAACLMAKQDGNARENCPYPSVAALLRIIVTQVFLGNSVLFRNIFFSASQPRPSQVEHKLLMRFFYSLICFIRWKEFACGTWEAPGFQRIQCGNRWRQQSLRKHSSDVGVGTMKIFCFLGIVSIFVACKRIKNIRRDTHTRTSHHLERVDVSKAVNSRDWHVCRRMPSDVNVIQHVPFSLCDIRLPSDLYAKQKNTNSFRCFN